jgi:hypothetical protein
MEIPLAFFGVFALLTVGRIAWEKLQGREPQTTDAEEREWEHAIK